MQIFITSKNTISSDALLINAINDFILIASFSLVEAEKSFITQEGNIVESITQPTESADAETFVASLSKPGLSNYLLNKEGFQVKGDRINLPEGIWKFNSAQVLDFNHDVYGSGERSARSMWKFSLKESGLLPVNSYAQTYLSKSPLRTAQRRYSADAILFLPFSSSTPLDDNVTLHVFTGNKNLVSFLNIPEESTIEYLTIDEVSLRKAQGDVFPDLKLNAPNSTTSAGIPIQIKCSWLNESKGVIPDGEEVFIETSGGYISKQRVKLINGVATFTFIPTGLTTGDVVTIQAGFRLFSGIASIDVLVE